MKRVPSLPEEPAGLKAFRRSQPTESPEHIWKAFRQHLERSSYRDLINALAAAQGGLCAYCERRLTDSDGALKSEGRHVDHVIPKSLYPKQALDWKNLLLCCLGPRSCGDAKGNQRLDPSCDPRTFPQIPSLFDIGIDGHLRVNNDTCDRVGIDPFALTKVIDDVLNLNSGRLRRARRVVLDNLLRWWPRLADQSRSVRLALVAQRLGPDDHGHLQAFWTTERQALAPESEVWLAQQASSQGTP